MGLEKNLGEICLFTTRLLRTRMLLIARGKILRSQPTLARYSSSGRKCWWLVIIAIERYYYNGCKVYAGVDPPKVHLVAAI